MHRVRVPVLEKFRSPLRVPSLPHLSPTPPVLQPASLVERITIQEIIFTFRSSVGNEETFPGVQKKKLSWNTCLTSS